MTDSPQPQPRIPGVRYRTETRYRPVEVTALGETTIEQEPYEVDVPLPPVDWDRHLMRFLLAVALGSTAAAIVWSTASISNLLGLVVTTTGIAIAAASLFELLWIMCLAAEWLLQGQPDRARPMRIAGWIAVMIVVAAVVAEGFHAGYPAAGIVGGAVSLMAKGAWWVVFRVRQVKLSGPVARALQRRLQDIAAAEALLGYKHRIGGRQAYAEAVYGPDAYAQAQTAVRAGNQAAQLPPTDPRPTGRVHQVQEPAPVPAAAPAPAPAPQPQPRPEPVPQAAAPSPAPQPEPEAEEAPQPEPAPGGSAAVLTMQPSIRQIVRTALDEDLDMPHADIVARVQQVHGTDNPKLPATVETYVRKELRLRKAS
ncbi:hypothetical protein ACKI16_29615 [Streptomyces scabiei]|uniref:hypothetical protein n=1 Tax=Streptomyces scabiei TaxID=1930 RepID=UPI0038F63D4A